MKQTPEELETLITAQGEKVRALKAAKKEKAEIDSEVKILLDLKSKLAALTGKPVETNAAAKSKKKKK